MTQGRQRSIPVRVWGDADALAESAEPGSGLGVLEGSGVVVAMFSSFRLVWLHHISIKCNADRLVNMN